MENTGVIARLLAELSWSGKAIRDYREGGRGYENVLTAEALHALDFLPRRDFLGAVLGCAHGAERARRMLIEEVESISTTLLPGNSYLLPGSTHQKGMAVQPDARLSSPSCLALVEAKRLRPGSRFQAQQLARQLVLVTRDATALPPHTRTPILLLILGHPPPVVVERERRKSEESVQDAIARDLPAVLSRMGEQQFTAEALLASVPDVVAWVTWDQVQNVIRSQSAKFRSDDPSVFASVQRLARAATDAIDWHR